MHYCDIFWRWTAHMNLCFLIGPRFRFKLIQKIVVISNATLIRHNHLAFCTQFPYVCRGSMTTTFYRMNLSGVFFQIDAIYNVIWIFNFKVIFPWFWLILTVLIVKWFRNQRWEHTFVLALSLFWDFFFSIFQLFR